MYKMQTVMKLINFVHRKRMEEMRNCLGLSMFRYNILRRKFEECKKDNKPMFFEIKEGKAVIRQ